MYGRLTRDGECGHSIERADDFAVQSEGHRARGTGLPFDSVVRVGEDGVTGTGLKKGIVTID